MIRLYKNVTGGHNKWWSFENRGTTVVYHWGKIGDSGVSKTKVYSYAWQATEAVNTKIQEKRRGGYVLCCPWCKGTRIQNGTTGQFCTECSSRLDDAVNAFWNGHVNRPFRSSVPAPAITPAPKPAPVAVSEVTIPKKAPIVVPVMVPKNAKCSCGHDFEMHVKGGQCAVCKECKSFFDRSKIVENRMDRFQLIELD